MGITRKTHSMDNPFSAFLDPQSFDFSVIAEAQRKAIDAVLEANRVVYKGYCKVSEKHVENMQKAFDKASSAYSGLLDVKAPDEQTKKQIALVQDFVSRGVDTARDVFDLTLSTNRDAFSVFQKHFSEVAEDAKTATKATA